MLEPAIGCADHAELHVSVFLTADSAELAILQQLKQFGLQRHIDLVDAVEEERAAIGQFDAPRLNRMRARERALLVSKQFAFQQRPGNCRAIHLHKRSFWSRRESWMKRASKSFPVPLSP